MKQHESKIFDTFACGLRIARGTQVVMRVPYEMAGTYEYPSLGVSSLSNACVSTVRGMMQYPAELLEVSRG